MKTLLTTLILLSLCLLPVSSQAQDPVGATVSWGPPLYGTPTEYHVEISIDGGATWTSEGNTVALALDILVAPNVEHIARVCGVYADGSYGPFCVPSDPYTPNVMGPPTVGGSSGCWLGVRQ